MHSFWNFPFPSKIDHILQTSNYTLQQLLDEDDVVVDTKNQKPDLIAFLSKEENVAKLLSYVVDDKPNGSANEKLRYPAVASEILISPVPEIQRQLLRAEKNYFELFFNFFKPQAVNLQRATLVVHVVTQLLLNHMKEMLEFLHSSPQSLLDLVKHVEVAAVPVFLFRLAHCEREEGGNGTQQWLVDIGVLDTLLEQFSPSSPRLYSDASNSILEFLGPITASSPILSALIEQDRCSKFLDTIQQSPGAFRYGMNVFLVILKTIADASLDTQDYPYLKIVPNGDVSEQPVPVQLLILALPKFLSLLQVDKSTERNDDVPPAPSCNSNKGDGFGFVRLRILQIIAALLSLHITKVTQAIVESEILDLSYDLLLLFPQNNFAHQAIEVVFSRLWEAVDSDEKIKVWDKMRLIQKLVEADPDHPKRQEKLQQQYQQLLLVNPNAHPVREPFVPYLYLIAVGVFKAADNDNLKHYLDSIEGWTDFIKKATALIEPNAESQRRGFHPRGLFRMF